MNEWIVKKTKQKHLMPFLAPVVNETIVFRNTIQWSLRPLAYWMFYVSSMGQFSSNSLSLSIHFETCWPVLSEFIWQCEVLIQSFHVRRVTLINLEISIYILTSILFIKMLEKFRYQFLLMKVYFFTLLFSKSLFVKLTVIY